MDLETSTRETTEPVISIAGDKVALGPIHPGIAPAFHRWSNDYRMLRSLRGTEPLPVTEAWALERLREISSRPDEASFVIYERESMRPVGTTVIARIDYRNRSGLYGIEIGEPDARGKGIGTETTRLMLDFAFTALGLHNVMLTVSELNPGGLRAYERAGFREFGRRRQSRWAAGKLCDDVYMECVATDFISPVLRSIFSPGEN